MSKRRLLILVSVLVTMAVVSLASFNVRSTYAASGSVLILDPTVTNGANSLEAQAAQALGFTVNVVDAATWGNMTTANFASYSAIILGDPTCVGDPSPLAAAEANTSVWGPAVKGNVVLIGTDPVFHAPAQIGAQTLIKNGVAFATSMPGKTGAYIDLSCYYGSVSQVANTAVPVLNGIASGFSIVGQGVCPNNSHIVGSSPILAGLTDANLSNWSCSTHEGFATWSPSFQVLAISEDIPSSFVAPDGTTGAPYILARTGGDLAGGGQPHLIFPFKTSTNEHPEHWGVLNGFDSFEHVGFYLYALDLARTDSSGNQCDSCTFGEPVLAAAGGYVVKFADESQTGCVAIRHNSFMVGQTKNWYFTIYCHLKTPIPLTNGQWVNQGDQIGQAWNTNNGACSNPCPPHIHFALISATDPSANNNRQAVDPMFLPGQVLQIGANSTNFIQTSWPWDGSVNQYGSPKYIIQRPQGG